jgi:chemotaxis protein MotB
VVVLSDASAEAKELLPGLDAGTTDAGTTDAGTPQEDTHG